MNKVDKEVFCGECGDLLDEATDLVFDERGPCPICGSTSRKFSVLIQSEIFIKSKLRLKGRQGGQGKPFVEIVKGDDLSRFLKKWMKLDRLIDRDNDRYEETITDPMTGQIVHQCKEPLSKHTGHGTARKKH